jgi:hypothetical protein
MSRRRKTSALSALVMTLLLFGNAPAYAADATPSAATIFESSSSTVPDNALD